MTSTYGQHFASTPQSEPLPGRPEMVQNAAGGYVFALDIWQRLRRFLILGCETGSYYESARRMTLANAEGLQRCLKADGARTVDMIVEISDKGLAPKNDPAIFALAVASKFGDPQTRKLAFAVLPRVCRIGTHLFQFCEDRQAVGGGWGRGVRAAIARWYERDDVVLQVLKFQQRNGWSHRDLLRLSHPENPDLAAVFEAVCRPAKWLEVKHPLAEGYLKVQAAPTAREAAAIVTEYKLPREFVPTQFLTEAPVWAALLPHMPMHALVRNLGNLSKCGLLTPLSETSKTVCQMLGSEEAIKRSRLHPFAVLIAARTYGSGRGLRGSGEWIVVPAVVDALDAAFDLAFHNAKPTGKRHVLGVDVSGSMSIGMGTMPMMASEAAAAMALITLRTEPECYIGGFAETFRDLKIYARDTLASALAKTRGMTFGATDTSVAIRWALDHKVGADVFAIYSDGETWAGQTHTTEALSTYRRKTGIAAKLAVVNFTATDRSIADPTDAGSMNFVGMDAALPQALSAFISL